MCELLGVSCLNPIGVRFSFSEFSLRGGGSSIHKDGWGIAFYQDDGGCRIFLEDKPAFNSKLAEVVKEHPIKSKTVISHIRRATVGKTSLRNTQPFTRIMWGKQWIFAHNGDMPEFRYNDFKHFNVVGQTDSEKVFCYIMDYLYDSCPNGNCSPTELARLIESVSIKLSEYGVLNFLMSEGRFLFAHGHSSLHYVKRAYPFTAATFRDHGIAANLAMFNNPDDQMLIVATQPLTIDENWQSLSSKKVYVFERGDMVS